MGRPAECASLVRNGFTPTQISREFSITFKSVVQYLYTAIGFGLLLKSDILFAIDESTGGAIEQALCSLNHLSAYGLVAVLKDAGICLDDEDAALYLDLRKSRVDIGDVYQFIAEIELSLHQTIQVTLKAECGDEEEGWWRKGVPQKVRIACVTRREEDVELPAEPYCYTTFSDLIDIIDKEWKVLSPQLPNAMTKDKGDCIRNLRQLNAVRNRVMHPVRSGPPSIKDFKFARDIHHIFCPIIFAS